MKEEKRVLYDYKIKKRNERNKVIAVREAERKIKEEKQRPKLNYDYIKSILDNQVMPNHTDMFYTLKKADSTNSFYVMFFYDDTYVTARISDHESKVGALGIVIDENTTKKQLVRMFENRIIALKSKYKAKMFMKFNTLYEGEKNGTTKNNTKWCRYNK